MCRAHCAYRKEKNQARGGENRQRERGEKGNLKEIKEIEIVVHWFPQPYLALGPCSWYSLTWGWAPHEPWIMVRLATSVEPLNFVFVCQLDQIDGMDLNGVGPTG